MYAGKMVAGVSLEYFAASPDNAFFATYMATDCWVPQVFIAFLATHSPLESMSLLGLQL